MTEQTTIFNPLPVCNSIRRSSAWASLARSLSAALNTHKKKVCRLIKFCALNGQIILIINLLPKQLAINYNLMMNYLLLTAWGKRRNQTLIIHWVIKFIGASAPPAPTPHPCPSPPSKGEVQVGVQSLDQTTGTQSGTTRGLFVVVFVF